MIKCLNKTELGQAGQGKYLALGHLYRLATLGLYDMTSNQTFLCPALPLSQ